MPIRHGHEECPPWRHYILHKGLMDYVLIEVYFHEDGSYQGYVETEEAARSPGLITKSAQVIEKDQLRRLRL